MASSIISDAFFTVKGPKNKDFAYSNAIREKKPLWYLSV